MLLFCFGALVEHDASADEALNTGGRLMVVLLPLFAWLVSVEAKERRNFPQHLYFALHVHAAWFAAWPIREVGARVLSPRLSTRDCRPETVD